MPSTDELFLVTLSLASPGGRRRSADVFAAGAAPRHLEGCGAKVSLATSGHTSFYRAAEKVAVSGRCNSSGRCLTSESPGGWLGVYLLLRQRVVRRDIALQGERGNSTDVLPHVTWRAAATADVFAADASVRHLEGGSS
jgi:hypothetical protein